MKQKRSILKSGVLVLFALIATALIAMTVMAEEEKFGFLNTAEYEITKPITSFYLLPTNGNGQCVKKSLKIISGKKYATVKLQKLDKKLNILLTPKKPGTVTFSFKYKEDGKVTSHTLKAKIVKYVCPVSKVKFGSSKLTKKFKTSFFCSIKGKKKTGKLTVTPKKGWKVESISIFGGQKDKQIKNGSKITLKRGMDLSILLFNIKSGKYVSLHMNMY